MHYDMAYKAKDRGKSMMFRKDLHQFVQDQFGSGQKFGKRLGIKESMVGKLLRVDCQVSLKLSLRIAYL